MPPPGADTSEQNFNGSHRALASATIAVPRRNNITATLGAGGIGASPQLAAAMQRASSRSLAVAASAPKRESAPIIVGGVLVHAQATKAGKENAEAGLPPGWSAHWSNTRSVWYWKGPGGEVAWDKPVGKLSLAAPLVDPEVAAKSALPPGWTAVWSKSKSLWYWRSDGGETTWTKPTTSAAHSAAETGDDPAAAAKADLPPGWAAVWSKSKSLWYWRHESSGETTWTKPSA